MQGDCKTICHFNSTCTSVAILSRSEAMVECGFFSQDTFLGTDVENGIERGTYMKGTSLLIYKTRE